MSIEEHVPEVTVSTDSINVEDSTKNQTGTYSAAVIETRNKIFIGNLSYKTTEMDLRSMFEEFGAIDAVSIPVRRSYRGGSQRPMGIAFVTFSTEESAQKAIDLCDGKMLMERLITVTHANPVQKRVTNRRIKTHRPKGRKLDKKHNNDAQEYKEPLNMKNKKGNVANANSDNGVSLSHKNVDSVTSSGGNYADNENKNSRSRFHRPMIKRGPKGPPADGISSKTTVFVAGLSYDTKDEQLREWFASYNPLHVSIALRPLPRYIVQKLQARGEPRKGRGFGFVTFENEAMQIKAVEEMNDKEICGRKLTVKIAIDKPKSPTHLNDTKDLNGANVVTDE